MLAPLEEWSKQNPVHSLQAVCIKFRARVVEEWVELMTSFTEIEEFALHYHHPVYDNFLQRGWWGCRPIPRTRLFCVARGCPCTMRYTRTGS